MLEDSFSIGEDGGSRTGRREGLGILVIQFGWVYVDGGLDRTCGFEI